MVARELGEKKVYAIDTGLCDAVEYRFSEDTGKALENAVYLELKRTGAELFFYRNETLECDFLRVERGRVTEAFLLRCPAPLITRVFAALHPPPHY